MLTTLALLSALSLAPAQADGLKLSNERVTFDVLGATRANNKLLPADRFTLSFDIDNLRVDDDGKVQYSMSMEVVDSKGKVWFKADPSSLVAYNSLGGRGLPAFANVDIGSNMPAGDYTLKVSVTDRTAQATASTSRAFEVLPSAFGIVRTQLTSDHEGRLPVPPIGVVGQTAVVNFAVVGFERDKAKKQPNVSVEMIVLDESNRPTLKKGFTGEVNENVPASYTAVPMQFLLNLNRAGKYTVKLKAVDQISKKTAEASLPVTVLEVK